jgi:hypothetical protein
MMATTIISSISVNPPWPLFVSFMPPALSNVRATATYGIASWHLGESAAECHLVGQNPARR